MTALPYEEPLTTFVTEISRIRRELDPKEVERTYHTHGDQKLGGSDAPPSPGVATGASELSIHETRYLERRVRAAHHTRRGHMQRS
jgi:hypothetical protein